MPSRTMFRLSGLRLLSTLVGVLRKSTPRKDSMVVTWRLISGSCL